MIQLIGLVYQWKTMRAPAAQAERPAPPEEEIIEFGVSAGEDVL